MTTGKNRSTPKDADAARHAFDGLDRVLHEKARLGILTALASRPQGLLFSDLKTLCALTDGNLNRHLAILREADFVALFKHRGPGRPRTLARLTETGQAAFLEYLEELERVLRTARPAAKRSARTARPELPPDWAPA